MIEKWVYTALMLYSVDAMFSEEHVNYVSIATRTATQRCRIPKLIFEQSYQ